jgi:hypothetical protein
MDSLKLSAYTEGLLLKKGDVPVRRRGRGLACCVKISFKTESFQIDIQLNFLKALHQAIIMAKIFSVGIHSLNFEDSSFENGKVLFISNKISRALSQYSPDSLPDFLNYLTWLERSHLGQLSRYRD